MRNHVGLTIDTTQIYGFRQAAWKSLLILLGALVFMIASGLMVVGVIKSSRYGIGSDVIGWIGIILSAGAAFVAVRRLVFMRGPVITVSSHGIRDTRVASETIPWSAIDNVSTWGKRDRKCVVLAIAPHAENTVRLTRSARLMRSANGLVAQKGVWITALGLTIDADDLERLIVAFRFPASKRAPSFTI